jgi:hypothetical protein
MEHGELEEKRRKISGGILHLQETIVSTRILDGLGGLPNRGRKRYWVRNVIFLNLIVLGPWLLIGFARQEFERTHYLWISGPLTIEFVIAGFLLANLETRRMLGDMPHFIVDRMLGVCEIEEFGVWLGKSLTVRAMVPFVSLLWLVWISLGIAGQSFVHREFVGFGFSLTLILEGLLAAIALHSVYWITRTAYQLRKYQYELNRFSPASSEIINNIYELVKKRAYGFSIYFAVFMLTSSSSLVDINSRVVFAWPAFLTIWTVMITQYLITRDTARVIVDRGKWKTLNRLAERMNSIEKEGDLSDREIAEKLLRLCEIHRQVAGSRTSTFDLNSLTTLLSQLMLPLLGLALGNSEKVSEFFHRLSSLGG